MTATAARATCASFSHCVRAAESRKSPQNSDFYGHRTTYSEKAHCIKDSVLLDPACGSGAFPMGVLHKLVHSLQKLDPENKYWYELQYQKALQESEEVFKQGDKNQREEMLKEINEAFDIGINYPDYARKLYIIENCIYGVDIQPIAIQISKLRFFISLVLDQKVDRSKENFAIRALPNLETKFVAANILIELKKPTQMILSSPEIMRLESEIRNLRHKYFQAKTRSEKLSYQKQDRKLRELLANELENIGLSPESSEKIAKFDLYDQNASADFFDPELMFGIKDGFDIVIGNPPYIQLQKAFNLQTKYADLYKNQNYETFDRTGDIYCLFYEKGIRLLKDRGFLAFITSNKWMRAGYGEKMRNFFLKYNPKILIDLGPNVFESSTVDTNILIIQKAENENKLKAVTISEKKKNNLDLAKYLKNNGVILNKLSNSAWFIGTSAEQRLKEKIERIGRPLKNWDVNIYYGIKTGLNEAFIIDTSKRQEILKNCKDEDERYRTEEIIKPILRGRDIKRYYYEWAGLWVIFIPWHFPLHMDQSIQGASKKAEEEFKKQYTSVYNHLLRFKKKLSERNKEETGIRYEWYALQRCAATYYHEFEKEKIIYSEIVREPQFHYDNEKFYVEATSFLMTGEHIKYICGLLNSKSLSFFFKKYYAGGGLGEEGYRYKKAFLENLPIPPIAPSNESTVRQIEKLVDKILESKKQNPQANTRQLELEIDQLVYKLYELTEEEIKIIETIYNRIKY